MTTLLVATTGGHLDQLMHFARRLPWEDAQHWVTSANRQSRSLLQGRDVTFVPYVGVRDLAGVARCLPVARRLHHGLRVTRALSTGSGVALGFLPYLAARGVPCHYIESAARVGGPSLTGRILRRVPGVTTYAQYRHWSDGGWHHVGSVFDAFAPGPAPPRHADALRVVVTLGTAEEFPFRRLVAALAPVLAPDGDLRRATGRPVEVLWQTGGTPVGDLPIAATPFMPADALAAALADADAVVCHAGTGSALGALQAGCIPVMAPRRRAYGEAGDDHQVELAGELGGRGLAVTVEADRLTVEHLLLSLDRGVRRRADPPPLSLRP